VAKNGRHDIQDNDTQRIDI
jgi:hypothetical protein